MKMMRAVMMSFNRVRTGHLSAAVRDVDTCGRKLWQDRPTRIQMLSWTARPDPQAESFWIVNPAAALNRSGGSGRSDAATFTAMVFALIVIPAVGVESIEATQKSCGAVAPPARVAV